MRFRQKTQPRNSPAPGKLVPLRDPNRAKAQVPYQFVEQAAQES
ncbi:MAG TPA: hypothetical protein VN708_27085 [Terriglobales bacterium]|nr:hypothetical protein [Terriglobales bacterium]